jgi:hypothetical protein
MNQFFKLKDNNEIKYGQIGQELLTKLSQSGSSCEALLKVIYNQFRQYKSFTMIDKLPKNIKPRVIFYGLGENDIIIVKWLSQNGPKPIRYFGKEHLDALKLMTLKPE